MDNSAVSLYEFRNNVVLVFLVAQIAIAHYCHHNMDNARECAEHFVANKISSLIELDVLAQLSRIQWNNIYNFRMVIKGKPIEIYK